MNNSDAQTPPKPITLEGQAVEPRLRDMAFVSPSSNLSSTLALKYVLSNSNWIMFGPLFTNPSMMFHCLWKNSLVCSASVLGAYYKETFHDCVHACKLLQSCITLHGCMDCSPPVSSVHGILQARMLEWVAMPSSRGSS